MDLIRNTIWSCKECDNPLVREIDRIPYPNFRATQGAGFLYHNAFNYKLGEPYEREMTTGMHTIRDIFCGQCNQYVGWRYDKAQFETESYKIGKFLMEGELLKQATGAIGKLQARL